MIRREDDLDYSSCNRDTMTPKSTRVFMSINLHKEETIVDRKGSGVRQDLESVWDQSFDIAATFDGGPR